MDDDRYWISGHMNNKEVDQNNNGFNILNMVTFVTDGNRNQLIRKLKYRIYSVHQYHRVIDFWSSLVPHLINTVTYRGGRRWVAPARRDDEYCWPEAMARRSNIIASVNATATKCQSIYGMRH